jgi:hypothetical protein
MADIGTLNPEQMLQQQQILRQQKMAEMLMQKGMEQPQSQIVSGHYVRPSIFQNLAGLANTYVGQRSLEKADQAQIDLANAIRNQESVALADYMSDLQGKPASQKQTELAGPYGQAGENGANIPMPMAVKDIPAVPANPMLANMNALQNPNSPAFLRAHAMKKITEGPNWAEVSKYNEKTGNTDTYVYDKNSSNPQSTMQFVSTSKPALDAYQQIKLNDEGIGTGRFGGSSVFTGNVPVANGGNVPASTFPVTGGTMPNKPVIGNASVGTVKPVSANSVPENDLVKTYGYDPFKPPPMPTMPSGSAARSWKADIYKPLEGTPANTVTGATTYVDALGKYNDYVNGLSARDLTNPQVRTKLNSLYSQVKLTGKEANNLGVLNGGDEKILESVVPNYSDILITKKTVQKILDEQKEFGSSKIVATYRTAQKPVPENMRKYIVVPKAEQEQTSQGSPKQTGATARAILNGEQIEVRNGKWVNSATGQEVK